MTELPGLERPVIEVTGRRPLPETERTMLDRLRVRYGHTYRNGSYVGRRYVIAEKVASSPGAWGGDRIADALVLDTFSVAHSELHPDEQAAGGSSWGKRQSIHGFEVKVSRSDWLAELRDPEKAEAWGRYCHYFWLVASSRGIVRDDLPAGWGLLVPHGRTLRAARTPTRRAAIAMPTGSLVSLARGIQRTEAAMALEAARP